ncbi:MAG: transglycosylase domain-containing protein [Pseudonocardia sp.]
MTSSRTGARPAVPSPPDPRTDPTATIGVGRRRAGERRAPTSPEPGTAPELPGNPTAARLVARARTTGESRAERPAGDGWRRWLEPSAYASLLAALIERVGAYRRRRRARLASLSRSQRIWLHTRVAGLAGVAMFLVVPALVFTLGYLFFAIPKPDDTVNKQVATISFADNSELARIVPEEGNRTKITIDQVPKPVQLAVLAAEDRSFFSNPGFDPVGIARAAWKQLTGGTGGGSTITQQYVKTSLVGDERSLWRKYKEMVIAVKISQLNSKDEILADYLNAIYFGRGAYGIQSASRAYFGKDVGQLDVSEGALLAGVIQSPSRWDPAVNPQRASARWNFVMDGMVSQGWLSPERRDSLRFPATQPRGRSSGGAPADHRGLILNAIRDELEQRGISEQELNQEGLKITTTIDPETQDRAVEAARKSLIGQPPNLRGALVSIEPDTGAILAYYGGDNGVGLDYARVSKQAGSTFKPFVLLAALQLGDPIGLGTRFKGAELPGLRNADGADCPVCDLKQAMTVSNNVVFHELTLRMGAQKVADAARQAGITSPLTDVNEGIALGNKEVTPIELASAYATFASGGIYHQPHLVSKVTTSDDRVIYEAVPTQERRFSEQVARNVTEAMLGVPAFDNLSLAGGRTAAAKTGTVQSRFEGENNDAWIAGYTSSVATAVWIGTDQNSPIRTSRGTPITGASLPGTIWKTFMNDATETRPEESFASFKPIGPPPAALGTADGRVTPPSTAATPSSAPAAPPPPYDPRFDVPDETELNRREDSDGPRREPETRRECGLLGCRTVEDRSSSAPADEENEPRTRSEAGADEPGGSSATTRRPVRG